MFMLKMHLRQSGLTYCALNYSGLLIKHKERIQIFKETADSRYIHRNELDRVCFQYDATYNAYKYLARSVADKVLRGLLVITGS